MVTIVNISATRFTLNGIPYYKNYISKVAGNRVIIFNAYDYRDVLVEYTSFDEFIVNGGTFASSQLLQNALISTLYTRAGTDGGANEFTELSDTPNSYTGQAGKVVKVNSTEDGLEFDDATGAVGTLQQVLQQGPEANIDTGDGISFSAKMPYFDGSGIDKFFSLVMAYENAGITFSSGLYGEAGLTQLNSQAGDATSSRIVQIGAPIPSPTEGEFNNILLAILQRIVTPGTTIDSSYNITYPTPVEGTSVVIRFPHILASGIYDLATQQWASALLADKADLVGGLVPASQLPGFVDDVLEYANLAAFPATGESGKLYVALDTNKTYRWSGSTYVALDEGVALGETSSTAYRGDRGKTAYDHSQTSGNPHGTTAAQVGAYTQAQVDSGLDLKMDKTAWIDISTTSTIVGFSTFAQRFIFYKIIDNYIFIDFYIEGASNSPSFTFTSPFNNTSGTSKFGSCGYNVNNGLVIQNPARVIITNNSNVLNISLSFTGAVYTATGTKACAGQISFKIN